MRDDAYKYLKATFVKDWLPVAPAKKRIEPDPMPAAPATKKLKVCGVGGMLDLFMQRTMPTLRLQHLLLKSNCT